VPRPGQARHDWEIVVDLARRLAQRMGDKGELFPYQTPEQIWCEHRESTRGRDLDISGLSYEILETKGPQQWPYVPGADSGKARLYEDGVFPTPSGRARFANTHYQPLADPVDARYPF